MADEKDPKDIETGKETPATEWSASDSTVSDETVSDKTVSDSTTPAVSDKVASEQVESGDAASDTKAFDPISPDPEQPAAEGGSVTDATAVPAVEGAERKGPSKLVAGLAAGLAGLLLIASITAAIVFGLAWHKNKVDTDAQNEAKEAACAYAPTLAGYDYKDLDTYFKNVLAGATGEFKKEFDSSSKELKDVLIQGQVQSKVADSQCGVKSGDKDHAEVIMVIGQNITSVGTKGQEQPGQLAMVASMEKVDGRWLVSKMGAPLVPQK